MSVCCGEIIELQRSPLIMSFPRAKLHRFNDISNGTPAPGSYDPKFGTKVKGAVIEKTGRFVESKPELDNSGNGVLKSSSMNCLPVFRTPPKKNLKNSNKIRSKENLDGGQSFTCSQEIISRGKDISGSSSDTSLKDSLDETLFELNTFKEQCAKLEEAAASKLAMISDLEHKNEELEAKVCEFQDKLQTVCSSQQEGVKDFEETTKDWLEQLSEIHVLLDDMQLGYDSLQQARELLQSTCTSSDTEQKMQQNPEETILLLQTDLSNAEAELVACRSECERMMQESAAHANEVNQLQQAIQDLEQRKEDEREVAEQQLQIFRDHVNCGSMIQETLETSLAEKEVALWAMETSYGRLLAECERLKEGHEEKVRELASNYEMQVRDVAHQVEIVAKLLMEKGLRLQTFCSKKTMSLEHKLQCFLEKVMEEGTSKLKRQLQASSDKLKEIQTSAQNEILNMKTVNEEKEREAAEIQAELERKARLLTEKLLIAEEQLRKATVTRDELRVSNMENQLTIVDLQDKVDVLTVEKNSESSMLKELQSEGEFLKAQNKMLMVGNRYMNHSLVALTARLLESEADVDRMTSQKENLELENLKLQAELKEIQEQRENQKSNIAMLEAENLQQIEEVRKELLEKLERYKSKAILGSEIMKDDDDKQLQIESLSIQLDMFKRDFQELGVYVAAIDLQNEELSQKLKVCQQQGKALDETLIRLAMQEDLCNSLSDDLNRQSNELQQCRNELTSAQDKVALQEEQILEYRCSIEKLTEDLGRSDTKVFKLNEVVCHLEETTAEQEKDIEALTEKLDHQWECAKMATQQIASLSSEIECHKDFSHQATEHMLNLTDANTEKDKQIESLMADMEALKHTNQEMSYTLKNLGLELTIAQQKLGDSVEEVKLLEADRFVKEQQLTELMASKDDSSSEVKQCLNCENEKKAVKKLQASLAEEEEKLARTLASEEKYQELYKEVLSLVGPFKDQLESYRSECNRLIAQKVEVEGEVHELAMKYAEILGHQNHKQKTRHMMNIKEQNLKLKEEVRVLRQTVEKLRKELASVKTGEVSHIGSKGKENIMHGSPMTKSPKPSPKPFADWSHKNVI